jgi:ABC-2 type transport system permease protein
MIGLYLSDHDSCSAVNSMISMPLFFTSTTLMPYEVMPAWLRTMETLNPVSYAIDSTRILFERGTPFYSIMGLAIGAGIMVLFGTYQFRKAVV